MRYAAGSLRCAWLVLSEQSAFCKAARPLLSPLASAASTEANLCVASVSSCSRASHGLAAAARTHMRIHLCCRYVNLQQGLAEDVARWFFQQIVLALDYMHRSPPTPGARL